MDLIEKARKSFNALDTDQSGYLEKQELVPVVLAWAASCKAETDIDLESALNEMMTTIDANSDGKLSLLEFVSIFETVVSTGGLWV